LLLLGFLLVCISEFVFERKAGIYSTRSRMLTRCSGPSVSTSVHSDSI
jgi:hypothetical protein